MKTSGPMSSFSFTDQPIDTVKARLSLEDGSCGGYASFDSGIYPHSSAGLSDSGHSSSHSDGFGAAGSGTFGD